jgi:hypothetical protein
VLYESLVGMPEYDPLPVPRTCTWHGVAVCYDAARVRFLPESAEAAPALLAHGAARVLLSWDLRADDGRPFPLTQSALLTLGHHALLDLLQTILRDYTRMTADLTLHLRKEARRWR